MTLLLFLAALVFVIDAYVRKSLVSLGVALVIAAFAVHSWHGAAVLLRA